MCIVSNVFDTYDERWRQPWTSPPFAPQTYPTIVPSTGTTTWPWGEEKPVINPGMPSKEDIEEFQRILEKARQWDIDHDEPNCESAEKKARLQELADELGIEIEFPE